MRTIALVTAILVALIGAALLWAYKQRFEATVSGGPKVQVAVVTSDIALGEALTADKLSTRGIPKAYLESRHIQVNHLETIVGVRVRARISAGETVLWSDLAIAGANSRDLAGLVLPTMRAIAVPASNALIFDGLLRPGDRVDVLVTRTERTTRQSVTRPLLQNLIVLATGRDMSQQGAPVDANRVATLTLMTTPEQAQLLTNEMTTGTLSFLLRNVDDIRLLKPDTTEAGVP